MMKQTSTLSSLNSSIPTLSPVLSSIVENLRQDTSATIDWQHENLNFVPLRGSWFANSEADFDLDEEIDKFLRGDKKVLLLMGDSGAGKSLYTQKLTIDLVKNNNPKIPIPIWVSLPSLKDPVNKVIEEILESKGINAEQIAELQKSQSFVFILDAYDEIKCLKNLYVSNHLANWNAKVIITCRREYLYHQDNYKLFFAPFMGDKIQYSQYEEIYIRPFNANQINTYVQKCIKSQVEQWRESECYQKAIEEIPGLRELIKTPFLLKLAVEVLPQIVERYATAEMLHRKRITQATLYDVFIEQWFIRQELKLKAAKHIKEDEDIKPEFWAYAKTLAMEMHRANLTQVAYDASDSSDIFATEQEQNPWQKFFNPKDTRIELLRTACLVRETSQKHYAFIHSSLLEYFLTRNLYEHLTQQTIVDKPKQALIIRETGVSEVNQKLIVTTENQTNKSQKQDYFNQRLLVKEDNTLQFLADRVSEQEPFKKSLFARVYSSRNNSQNKIAAANAITILNRARVVFSGMDLSGVQIAEADLSFGIYHHTNFAKADLRGANLRQAYLSDANFSQSNMEDVDFVQLPLLVHEKAVNAICYSSDGVYLAAACENFVVIWHCETLQEIKRLCSHKDKVNSIAFCADRKLLASCSSDKSVKVWDLQVEKPMDISLLNDQNHTIFSLAFSFDGKLLAIGGDKSILLWDVSTHQFIGKPLEGEYMAGAYSLAFSPDGELLASGGSWKVGLWQIKTQQSSGNLLEGHTGKIIGIAFSPSGKLLASGTEDSKIIVWDVKTRQQIGSSLRVDSASIAFSPDGQLMVSSGAISSLRSGGMSCSPSRGKSISIISVNTLQEVGLPLEGHTGNVNSVIFSPNGKFITSASDDKTVRLWSTQSLDKQSRGKVNANITNRSIAFSPDGNYLAYCNFNTALLWDVKMLQIVGKPFEGHTRNINCLIFSPDGEMIATANDDSTVRLWSVKTQQIIGKSLEGHASFVNCVAFSPDGLLLASGGQDCSVMFWNAYSQQPIGKPCERHTDRVSSVVFSPDGQFLVSGSWDSTLQIWRVKTQQAVGDPLKGHTDFIKSIAYSPNGTLLASGGIKELLLWKMTIHQPTYVSLVGHKSAIMSVAFTPDGNYLASGGNDCDIRFWCVESKMCIRIYNALQPVWSISFSRKGNYFAISNHYDAILLLHKENNSKYPDYILMDYTANPSLTANGLNLNQVQSLSERNLHLLRQLGAVDKTVTDKPFYSSLNTGSTTLFKPVAVKEIKKETNNLLENKNNTKRCSII